nr:MAG TPA: hypothetical protein [Caudoviricetes sp.]
MHPTLFAHRTSAIMFLLFPWSASEITDTPDFRKYLTAAFVIFSMSAASLCPLYTQPESQEPSMLTPCPH